MLRSSELKSPRVAVIIPIYRHSTLLSEAIDSVIDQATDFSFIIVLVNDGCPHEETIDVCLDYRRSYPEGIYYLRKPNGGLSSARNTGIRFVLEHEPTVEAIYLLDADNKIRAFALERGMKALDESPAAGWVYPNIDMFGLDWSGDYGGSYSRLTHSKMNICEAGSLIRRSVFESGVMFDETFRSGFEDWEFFLSAASAGFCGVNHEYFGFQYRKRPESMLADSERSASAIREAMRQKHHGMFHPRSQSSFEHVESPRYAVYLSDKGIFQLKTDPRLTQEECDFGEFERRFWSSISNSSRHYSPPFVLVTSRSLIRRLSEGGLLHWAFWKLEALTDAAGIASLSLTSSEKDRVKFSVAEDGKLLRRAAAVMISQKLLKEVALDRSSDWIDSLFSSSPLPRFNCLEIGLPGAASDIDRESILDFLAVVHRLSRSQYRVAAAMRLDWRSDGVVCRDTGYKIVRECFGGAVAYPRISDERRHLILTIPIVEFGGVEKVALNVAEQFRSRGYGVHLVILQANDVLIDSAWRNCVESINFASGDEFVPWGGGTQSYYGTEIPGWAQQGDHGFLVGLLFWADIVIDFHGGGSAAVMGRLRKLGVKTATSLHLSDKTLLGRPVGNTYLALSYEHAFDYFLPCSNRLADWLHGMGVPKQKIFPVLNCAAFPIDSSALADSLARRASERVDGSLRILFLGRLDPQKGIERVGQVVAKSRDLDVEWRIVGKSVLGEAELPEALLGMVEPPLLDARSLFDAMDWADVIVSLSDYEGLPLTVLEAMRQGVVVVATDVGAVSEVVDDGYNGFLLPLEDCVERCVERLRGLALDREFLRRVSLNASNSMRGRVWNASIAAFANAVALT